MITAIRKDARVSLTDDEIVGGMFDAMDDGLNAQACIERLAGTE